MAKKKEVPPPKQLVEEWLVALRSGEIEQIEGQLGSTTGQRCCLGVACDIAVRHGIIPPPKTLTRARETDTVLYYGTKTDNSGGGLPNKVAKAFGGHSTYGEDGEAEPQTGFPFDDYAEMNDSGKSFKQIAVKVASRAKKIGLL